MLALALSVTAGLTAGDVADKKKKKSKAGGTVDMAKIVAAPIPDATASIDGTLTSTIDVAGKQFKGTRIRDVNVTVSTTGSSGPPYFGTAQPDQFSSFGNVRFSAMDNGGSPAPGRCASTTPTRVSPSPRASSTAGGWS